MIRDGLYHRYIYWPKEIVHLGTDIPTLVYCPHALEKAKERKISLPSSVTGCYIPEVKIEKGKVVSAIYRAQYGKFQYICLVLHIINDVPFMVRTVWINNISHVITLDENRYVQK